MKNKFLFFVLAIFALTLLTLTSFNIVSADEWTETTLPAISYMLVYIDGEYAWYGNCTQVNTSVNTSEWYCSTQQIANPGIERGSTLPIKVAFSSNIDLEEVKVHAWMSGYHDEIESKTSSFDVFEGNEYVKRLNLEIPSDLDARDTYTLHVKLEQQQDLSGIEEAKITMDVQRASNLLEILSMGVYSTSTYSTYNFEVGDNIFIDVVVKNRGNYEAEDVYVRASINELGIERTVYLGDLEPYDDNDDEDAKQITVIIPLPKETGEGTYTIEIRAYNNEASDTAFSIIKVKAEIPSDVVEGKVEITPQITSNEIERGKGAVYTIIVANFGSTTENFIIETVGTEGWATTQITPSAFSLSAGQSKLVNVYIAVNEGAITAEHVFSVKVKYGSEVKQYNLVANISGEEEQQTTLKTVLMAISIALAAVIVVLLIVLITRKQAKTEEESYY